MLAAGGTGGHLFPAFALAQELGRRAIAVDLVTDMRGDRYGARLSGARRLSRALGDAWRGARRWRPAGRPGCCCAALPRPSSCWARSSPARVVGFGGYPAFPPLVAARLRGIPTALHEQNAVLGRANRMLAARVTAIATSFEHTKHLEGPALGRARLTGNPGARSGDRLGDAELSARRAASGPFSLLVFGGSQGARFFSDALPPALALLPAELRASLFVVQQCREEDLARVEAAYQAAGVRAHLATFFANLPEEMAKAHLVIGRAGASTVAELTVMGRPAILVPLPHAIDNDQLQNATRLAESGGGLVHRAEGADAGAPGRARSAACWRRPRRWREAAAAAKRQGRPDAVVRLADLVEELVGSRRKPRKACSARRRSTATRDRQLMQMPGEIGPVHILGIGGIGMSAIAEILHAKGYTVQGSDQKDSANVRRLRAKGIRVFVGHDADQSGRRALRRHLDRREARQSRAGGGARQGPAHHPPRRDAGRADAALRHRLGHRHARQDHHHLAHRPHLQRRRPRPDRHHRRHHQRVGLQRAARQRPVDDRGGRRVRRHLHQDPDADRRRHQHRPGASRLLQDGREHAPRVRDVLPQHSLLRPRRHLHRPSRRRAR